MEKNLEYIESDHAKVALIMDHIVTKMHASAQSLPHPLARLCDDCFDIGSTRLRPG